MENLREFPGGVPSSNFGDDWVLALDPRVVMGRDYFSRTVLLDEVAPFTSINYREIEGGLYHEKQCHTVALSTRNFLMIRQFGAT